MNSFINFQRLVTDIMKLVGVKDITDITFQNIRFHNYVSIPKIGNF